MAVTYVETREVPLAQLSRFPGNARRGDVEQLRASIRRHGQYRSLVVRDTGDQLVILAGNHTHDALKAEGHTTARCELVRCTDDEARRINLADNRLAELGQYDLDALAELLSYLDDDYDGTGYTTEDVEALINPPQVTELPPALGDPDAVLDVPKQPITQPGDIWLLGPHRIICGDCRDFETVTKLLDGARVNVAFTSPPYASQRKYDESSGFRPIPPDEYVDWFADVQANVRAVLADDGSWFVNIKEHCDDGQRHLYVKDLTIAHVRQWAWRFVDELCWVDSGDGFPGGYVGRFKDAWEPVFHFTAAKGIKFNPLANGHPSRHAFAYDPAIKMTIGSDGYGTVPPRDEGNGLSRPSNVIQFAAGGERGVGHSAAFPVDLPAWFIRAYSDEGDTVFDPFMGSGTTLVAAHREDRVAYGSEISPAYTDVICTRFQQFAGIKPVLQSTGEPFDFTAEPANQ